MFFPPTQLPVLNSSPQGGGARVREGGGGEPPTAPGSALPDSGLRTEDAGLPPSSLLELLLSPDHSLTDIAAHFNTTTESIILWMSRPDIAARLDTSNSALAFRARLAATSCLPSVIAALDNILTDFTRKPAATAPTPDSRKQPSLTPELLRLRQNETARKAGTLLVRLCHFRPLPANATTPQRAATSPPSPAVRDRGKGDEAAQPTIATAIPDPTTPIAPHFATSSLCHSATSSSPAAPTAAHVPAPSLPHSATSSLCHSATSNPRSAPPNAHGPTPDAFSIPHRASFPDDDAYLNHLAQLVGIDPAELDNLSDPDLPESLLANTS